MRVQGEKVLARRNSWRSGGMICCEGNCRDGQEGGGWARIVQDLGLRLEIQLPQEGPEKRDMICLRSEQAHLDCSVETRLLPQGQSRQETAGVTLNQGEEGVESGQILLDLLTTWM